jgi:BirA family biotin operon repressor/biotin-[acetyl-CoA-carboxylase] ligase
MVGADPLKVYDGMNSSELRERLGVPEIFILDRVSSVLDVVHDLAAQHGKDGTVVLAEEQEAGRGRHGRHWYSPRGAGIWLGYLKRPGPDSAGGVMAVRVGLAVAGVLGELGIACSLKWPNDIFVCDRKLGGVLCEARWSGKIALWVAIGVGLNMRGPLPEALAGSAIAVDEVLPGVTRVRLLEQLLFRLHELSVEDELTGSELDAYASCDWLRGREVSRPFRGLARGIAADGALLIETRAGLERVMGGSVVAA